MKAALLYGQEDVRITDVDLLPVEPFGLRIRILSCGICGSDVRMFFTGPTPRYIHPVILGHELCGQVIEVGTKLDGFAPGDLVALAPLISCMRCPACSRGEDNLCEQVQVIGCNVHGGMAKYFTVPSQMVLAGGVVKLPSGIDHRAAALTELVGCCLHGLRHMRMAPEDRVLIIGDGPIGLTFLQLIRLMGAKYVATSGRRPWRRELAAELGADEALDATIVNLKEKYDRSLDRVILATSNTKAVIEALDIVRSGGDVLLFSGYATGTTLPLDVNAVHYRELHIHGSIDCTVRDFREAARWLPRLRMERLVTAAFPLNDIVKAFHATAEQDAVKIIIEP